MHRHALFAVFLVPFFSIITDAAFADNRVALVIGNGAYVHAPHLPNPPHDAEDVAAALKRTGFETIVATDLDQAGMQNAAIRFARVARTADVAVFYYSGHAMQYAGVNYLVPIDAELHDEADLRRMARVDEILGDLQQAKNLRILVLDSCRDNPLADEFKRAVGQTRSASVGRGLAKMESPEGTIISYSTQAGRTASDGNGRNSPYTSAFLRHIEDKEDVATVFHRISANVYETTSGTQVPELSLSFSGEFYLNGKLQVTVTPPTPPAPADPCAFAADHWKAAEAIGNAAAFEDHLLRFPNCAFAALAKARIESFKNKTATAASPGTQAATPAQPAGPRSSQQNYWPDCNIPNPKTPSEFEAKISGCTHVLDQAGYQPEHQRAIAFANRGMAYGNRGDIDLAIVDFGEAIRIDPEFPNWRYARAFQFMNRALQHGGQDDCTLAVTDLSEAIRLKPAVAAYILQRGRARECAGQLAEALIDFRKAQDLDPSDSAAGEAIRRVERKLPAKPKSR
jgi:tetratricopeptide (TPR) repeat protein